MATKGAYKRLTKEYVNIQKSPPAYLYARPYEGNILEWHYVLKGPPETPYHGGEYHGYLKFPSEYPFKPPSIRMLTPNGRFQTDTRLCLSMSDFHPGTWNPSWSVSTILNGLLSFMSQNETTTGSTNGSTSERISYARRSHDFNMSNPRFVEMFPELCGPQQIPLHIAFPNAPVTEAPPTVAPATAAISIASGPARRVAAAKSTATATAMAATGTGTGVGGTGSGAAAAAVGAGAGAGAMDRAVRQQSLFSMGHWHKWLAVLLVCGYLLVARSITRASANGQDGQ